ncbi:MAG: serine/threonine protein kinase, partial [Planctomycetota bacterium]
MNERDEAPSDDSAAQLNDEVRLPNCGSPFEEQLSNTSESESNPEVDLKSETAVSDVSSRLEKLSETGRSSERYILKGEVGRGGMGAILKIFDVDLRRNLAMKVILSGEPGTGGDAAKTETRMIMRFIEEAQVTGQLDHPGVVPVHELGVDKDGQVFFTMRLVKGQELAKVFESVHADDPDWNMTRALGVLLKVCEAMSYAHEKGVVHRDLKPANVMVGRHGAVYVMDWGLARVDGREDSHDVRLQEEPASLSELRTDRRDLKQQTSGSPCMTMDGSIIGTPFYMPPE